jgi:hypothetical protein
MALDERGMLIIAEKSDSPTSSNTYIHTIQWFCDYSSSEISHSTKLTVLP